MKVSQRGDFMDEFSLTTREHELTTPLKIDPGNTVKGWIGFKVPRDLVQPDSIDSYRLTVIDTREDETFIDFAQVRKTVFEVRGRK